MVAGIASGVAISVTAQQIGERSAYDPENCDGLKQAIAQAVNNPIRMVAMTSPDPGKYFSINSSDSCFGDLATANLDLSRLIPDPLGLLTDAISAAVDKLKDMAVKKVCTAVRDGVGETISKYNNAINTVNGTLDGQLIDNSIGDLARRSADQYSLNWQTRQGQTSKDIWAGASLPTTQARPPANQVAGAVQGPGNGSVGAPVQSPAVSQATTGAAVFGR
jgi:hypothetical protein